MRSCSSNCSSTWLAPSASLLLSSSCTTRSDLVSQQLAVFTLYLRHISKQLAGARTQLPSAVIGSLVYGKTYKREAFQSGYYRTVQGSAIHDISLMALCLHASPAMQTNRRSHSAAVCRQQRQWMLSTCRPDTALHTQRKMQRLRDPSAAVPSPHLQKQASRGLLQHIRTMTSPPITRASTAQPLMLHMDLACQLRGLRRP